MMKKLSIGSLMPGIVIGMLASCIFCTFAAQCGKV